MGYIEVNQTHTVGIKETYKEIFIVATCYCSVDPDTLNHWKMVSFSLIVQKKTAKCKQIFDPPDTGSSWSPAADPRKRPDPSSTFRSRILYPDHKYPIGTKKTVPFHVSQSGDKPPSPVSRPLSPFKSAEGAFTAELFNRNENPEKKVNTSSDGMNDQTELMPDMEKIQTTVYQKAKEQGRITRKEVEQGFGFGSTKAFKVLKSLCEDGLLIQQKSGNRTVYVPSPDRALICG